MSDGERTREGRCLCGAVTYRVTGPMRPVVACHCKQCRRASGHHMAATWAPRERIDIADPEAALVWYDSSPGARRGFCGRCGSNLFWERRQDPGISIWAGGLDDPTGLKLAGHIYVANKGDYYEIADGLPQVAVGSSVEVVAAKAQDGKDR